MPIRHHDPSDPLPQRLVALALLRRGTHLPSQNPRQRLRRADLLGESVGVEGDFEVEIAVCTLSVVPRVDRQALVGGDVDAAAREGVLEDLEHAGVLFGG